MATKVWASRASTKKGMFADVKTRHGRLANYHHRFAWVNASYVYGLQIVNAHMRRALGALTPYPTLIKAIEQNNEKALAGLLAP